MIRSLYTAATGMDAQQLNLDVIANNLANVNTSGFKKSRADFQDLLYQTIKSAGSTQSQGAQVPSGIQVGLGTRTASTQRVFTTGEFESTNNSLNMAIEGSGFFQVMTGSGQIAYTRDGSFQKDSNGRIVTSDGYVLQPEISVPSDATTVSILPDGTVQVTIGDSNVSQDIGQIQLASFQNPAGLNANGRNLFSPTSASGDAIVGTPGDGGLGTIAAGYLERSNVSVVEEMVSMIVAQRAYEVNSKSIQTADEMLNIANNLRR